MSAQRIARAQAYLGRVDRAEKLARYGVLGFCAPPASYRSLGLNVMADVWQTPQVPVPNVTSSSLVSSSGSGVLDSKANLSARRPVVIPINGSGQGVANDPEYPPLTVQTRRSNAATCPLNETIYQSAPDFGQSPEWGDALAQVPVPSAGGVTGWIQSHLLLAGALVLGGLAVVSSQKTQRNRGRR